MQYLGMGVAAVFLVGWIIPLVVGIVQLRRRHGPLGVVLTVVGALWALPAIIALVAATIFYVGFGRDFKTYSFDPTEHSGACATIIVPWRGEGTLTYRYDGKRYESKSAQGQIAVPAGELSLSDFTAYSKPDEAGWRARNTLYENSALRLAAHERRPLTIGPPYTARVSVEEKAGKATVDLAVKDVGGHEASLADPGGKSPPRFEVLDEAGKVVWQGKFEYG